jgi:hypothetical protein
MNAKALLLAVAFAGLGLSAASEAGATDGHRFKKKPPAARNVPELNATHAAIPATLLLAGVAVVAGRRRKQQSK